MITNTGVHWTVLAMPTLTSSPLGSVRRPCVMEETKSRSPFAYPLTAAVAGQSSPDIVHSSGDAMSVSSGGAAAGDVLH